MSTVPHGADTKFRDKAEPIWYDSARRPIPAIEELIQLIRYRDLLTQLVSRNIKTRYKRSVIGVVWTMLNPLMTMTVMAVVFSSLLRISIQHYPVFLLSGLLAWTFFSQATLSAMGELIWGSSIMKRIYIPRTVFAATAVGTSLVNLVLSLIPLAIVMALTGVHPTLALVFLPVPMVLLTAFATGVGLLLSTVAAYFTDVMEMYQVVLTAWMYLTPVFYTADLIPQEYRWLVYLNPVSSLVEAFRAPFYAGSLPDLPVLRTAALSAVFILVVGWFAFTKKAEEIVYRV